VGTFHGFRSFRCDLESDGLLKASTYAPSTSDYPVLPLCATLRYREPISRTLLTIWRLDGKATSIVFVVVVVVVVVVVLFTC